MTEEQDHQEQSDTKYLIRYYKTELKHRSIHVKVQRFKSEEEAEAWGRRTYGKDFKSVERLIPWEEYKKKFPSLYN